MHHASDKFWNLASSFTLAVCAALAGCKHLPHNDVLIFGTETNFGVSVGVDSASTQTPSITIGYKRREAVWMPLLVNGQHSVPICGTGVINRKPPTCTEPPNPNGLDGPKYVGEATRNNASEHDTYSVFASFGGKGTAGTNDAGLQIAQFFATGIAAQRLASNPMAPQLVSIQSEAAADATAKAANAQAVLALADFAGLSPEETKNAIKVGEQREKDRNRRLSELQDALDGAAIGAARDELVAKLVGDVKISKEFVDRLKTTSGDELRATLEDISTHSVIWIDRLHTNLPTPKDG